MWGGKYVQYYCDGKKVGRSELRRDFFGKRYRQYFREDGTKAGRIEKTRGWFGNTYIQKYDRTGKKSGRSEKRRTLLGGKYVQHYDAQNRPIYRTELRTGWLGTRYIVRTYRDPGSNDRSTEPGTSPPPPPPPGPDEPGGVSSSRIASGGPLYVLLWIYLGVCAAGWILCLGIWLLSRLGYVRPETAAVFGAWLQSVTKTPSGLLLALFFSVGLLVAGWMLVALTFVFFAPIVVGLKLIMLFLTADQPGPVLGTAVIVAVLALYYRWLIRWWRK